MVVVWVTVSQVSKSILRVEWHRLGCWTGRDTANGTLRLSPWSHVCWCSLESRHLGCSVSYGCWSHPSPCQLYCGALGVLQISKVFFLSLWSQVLPVDVSLRWRAWMPGFDVSCQVAFGREIHTTTEKALAADFSWPAKWVSSDSENLCFKPPSWVLVD